MFKIPLIYMIPFSYFTQTIAWQILQIPQTPKTQKLLDQVRNRLRTLLYSVRTEATSVNWLKRLIIGHGKKQPKDMGAPGG
jgi:hypothetical protein